MKTKLHYLPGALALLAFSTVNSELSTAQAQGTAFTYQGRLNDGANPANGSYDLTFSLFNASSGGSQVGSTLTHTAVGVANGLFAVTADFGAVFDGTAYWLQIGVRTNGSTTYTTLKPLQELTPVPYAITAENLTGVLPLAQLPAGVLTNNETSVTFGNVAIGGKLTLAAAGTISSGGNSFLAGLTVDPTAQNTGNVNSNALVFGGAYGVTGEGIASKRSGANPYDLEFYTDYQNRITIINNGNVGINATTPTETLEINGTSRIDDNDMYLRTGTDRNHGLGYRATVLGTGVDGPFLYGFNGGVLGTSNPDSIALRWDYLGNTWVSNNASINAGLNVDLTGRNIGNVNSNALVFGSTFGNTGEGIASKRSGANAYDLEFYTDYINRMTISQNGNVNVLGTMVANNLTISGNLNLPAGATLAAGGVQIANNQLSLAATTSGEVALSYVPSGLNGVDQGTGPFLSGYYGGALGTANPNNPVQVALSWTWNGDVWVSNNLTTAGLNIDENGANTGVVNANALTFGISSGEGIASKRTAKTFDLEFYTGFNNRMTIANNGNVGINATTPTETLEINGTSRIDDHDMYLRTGTDHNHGLGYRATVSGSGVDGPFLYGYSGGVLGTSNPESIALSWDRSGNARVNANLSTGTLTIRGGADVAEPFPVTGGQVEPGTVMVIDEANPGQLSRSARAYDTRVAGVISGAGGVKPGLELQQEGVLDQGQRLALSGRVYVQADASLGAIRPGDLLTTSEVPGCAMKVGDHARAQGAILGKAMTGLTDGRGLVLVLVTLQ